MKYSFCASVLDSTHIPYWHDLARPSFQSESSRDKMATDPEAVGKAFISYYYQLFEQNRPALATLYQEQSMLTFEGNKFQGAQAIVGKLTTLQFGLCKITLATQDFQPSISGGILVFTTGNIQTEPESPPLKFSQVFHLMPVNNSFIVTNDMFRLNYG
ncbi:hypothetical protein CEUSTIGMA_g2934.t1 [Chlamydomonas eustigma]|uniref:NTF2 domain-containing protein n=1 Tax=Chlamydomonas eustigma TaxID=1157962 RepID=A0A250WXE7_9CHLO|nr:hypothetical protein CEUSTIGMA_g2934.t1 [Chlamydomonas eustigma]|eukprot:GAX75491.1 hypothetical protein CEUSTIGMA_g2934.t1 [Chlamydomonas eustigma]